MDYMFYRLEQMNLLKDTVKYREPPEYGGVCFNCGKWLTSDKEGDIILCECGEKTATHFRMRDYEN